MEFVKRNYKNVMVTAIAVVIGLYVWEKFTVLEVDTATGEETRKLNF